MNTTTANPADDDNPQSQPGEAPPQPGARSEAQFEAGPAAQAQPLSRPVQDRMLAGVAAGVARYLRVDVTLVRIVLTVLVFAGGTGVPIYLAGWLLIPEEGHEQSIAGEFIESRQARSH
jgi:phage shock protein PspC (stress-responsive transcriptional regulator)